MKIQWTLNTFSIDYMPVLSEIISKAERFDANQMHIYAFAKLLSSPTPFEQMSDTAKVAFENELLIHFEMRGWVK